MVALVLEALHVFAAIWMTTGLIGRYVAMSRAERSTDITAVRTILPLAAVFENRMAIPGSTAVLVLGLLAAWRHGYPILGFIQGGAVNWVLVSLVLFLTIIPVIVLVFVPRGRVFEAALNDAVARDHVTPELNAAFRDPVVRAAHYYELGVVAVILALMVLKPF